jgi:HlyD family secretion protein
MNKEVFRKVSLERLSSPEQLDQLMQVTTSKGWVALAAAGALLIMGFSWSIAGTLPERVAGQGILVRSGGVFEVVSPTDGRVTDVSVQVGDSVREGQVVGRIEQQAVADRLRQARAALADQEAQQRQLTEYGDRNLELQRTYLRQQRTNIQQQVASAQAALKALGDRLANEEQLVTQGLLTRQTVIATQQQVDALRDKVRSGQADLTQVSVRELELRNQLTNDRRSSEFKVAEARREVARLENDLRVTSEVVSAYTGRILEVMTEQGHIVERGEPVIRVDLTGKTVKDLEAVVYVPSEQGKKLRPGMEIRIAPTTAKKEEYGMMLGRVTYVSDFPATPKGMNRVLKNEQLVSALAGRDAPYEVHADLIPDASTVSSYRWSSSKGPPIKVQSGTLAAAEITVARRRPIVVVFPVLKRYTEGL